MRFGREQHSWWRRAGRNLLRVTTLSGVVFLRASSALDGGKALLPLSIVPKPKYTTTSLTAADTHGCHKSVVLADYQSWSLLRKRWAEIIEGWPRRFGANRDFLEFQSRRPSGKCRSCSRLGILAILINRPMSKFVPRTETRSVHLCWIASAVSDPRRARELKALLNAPDSLAMRRPWAWLLRRARTRRL